MTAMTRLMTLALAGTMLAPVAAHAQALTADEAATLRAEIADLKAKLAAVESRLDSANVPAAPAAAAQAPAAAPTGTDPRSGAGQASAGQAEETAPGDAPPTELAWKGAVQARREDGWSFKPKGRIQYDAGIVSHPPGSTDRGLGFASEARRIRLGGEGTMPGGFGYKLELELSDNSVDLVDTYISYRKGGFQARVGNQNEFQSLDELIGDTSGSTMERAAFTDAFNFERRLGLALEYGKGPVLIQGGVFTDDIESLANSSDGDRGGDENNSYGVDGRLVFAPKLDEMQLHFGASAHWRDLGRLADATTRYRQRPYLHTSNTRFIDTGNLDVTSETHYGVELAGVRGRFHFAGEAHWLKANRIAAADPTFFGAYAEIGYFLTGGDTRPYKGGIFERATPSNPVGEGGIGSIQLNLRYDYLDLDDAGILGGKQDAYIAALVWSPINYLRFNLNYARLIYSGAAVALPDGRRDYGVNAFGIRAELDY